MKIGFILLFALLLLSFASATSVGDSDSGFTKGRVVYVAPEADINYSLIPTVNSSDFWDSLDDPSDIDHNLLNNLEWSNAGHTMDIPLDMAGNDIENVGDINISGITTTNTLNITGSFIYGDLYFDNFFSGPCGNGEAIQSIDQWGAFTCTTVGNASFNQSLADTLYAKYQFTDNNFNGSGNFNTIGNTTASYFFGDGSGLTRLAAGNQFEFQWNDGGELAGDSGFKFKSTSGYLELDGSGDYVETSSFTQLSSTLTLSVWISRTDNTQDWEGIVLHTKKTSTYGGYGLLSMDDGKVRAWVDDSFNTFIETTNAVGNDGWHHLALRSDGTNFAIYVDGEKASLDQSISSYTPASQTLRIGFSMFAGEYFNGKIDEIMLFDTSLGATEIGEIYDLGRDAGSYTGTSAGNLVSHWRFDDGTADDNVGSNDGTLVGDAHIVGVPSYIFSTFDIKMQSDAKKSYWGAGDDASITCNASDMIINPKEVGSGKLYVLGDLVADSFIGDGSGLTGIGGVSRWLNTSDYLYIDSNYPQHINISGNATFGGGALFKGAILGDESLGYENIRFGVFAHTPRIIFDNGSMISQMDYVGDTLRFILNDSGTMRATMRVNNSAVRIGEAGHRRNLYLYGDLIGVDPAGGGANIIMDGNITAENVFLPAYIRIAGNSTQSVVTSMVWVNVTLDKQAETLKKNIEHTWNDETNDTITINDAGVYKITYTASFVDSAPNPDAHIGMRLYLLDGTVVKGSYSEVDTHRQDEEVFNTHSFLTEFDAGDKFKIQFTSDDTTVSSYLHATFEPGGSIIRTSIHKVSN